MFVGETGILRVVERTATVDARTRGRRPASPIGLIDLPTMQRYLNFWFSSRSTSSAARSPATPRSYFATGLKGRAKEERYEDHVALTGTSRWTSRRTAGSIEGGRAAAQRDERGAARAATSRTASAASTSGTGPSPSTASRSSSSCPSRFPPPRRHLRRPALRAGWATRSRQGECEAKRASGSRARPTRLRREPHDRPVFDPKQMANWIAAPKQGIKGKPVDFEYVRHD